MPHLPRMALRQLTFREWSMAADRGLLCLIMPSPTRRRMLEEVLNIPPPLLVRFEDGQLTYTSIPLDAFYLPPSSLTPPA